MAEYTDEDEADLKAIAKGSIASRDGGRSGAWERQFGKRKAPAAKTVVGGANPANDEARKLAGMNCGGKVKGYAKGGAVDGIAQRGKTRGKYI